MPCTELRKVLRRCEKALTTKSANKAGSGISKGGVACGTRRTMELSTLGGGLNERGPTSNSFSTRTFLLQQEVHVAHCTGLREKVEQQRRGDVVGQIAHQSQRCAEFRGENTEVV